jgi:hypothetical protein
MVGISQIGGYLRMEPIQQGVSRGKAWGRGIGRARAR